MDDEAAIAEERVDTWFSRKVEVKVGGLKARARLRRHFAVLTAQITDLASLGLGGVADGGFAAHVGIQVGAGGRAVAI